MNEQVVKTKNEGRVAAGKRLAEWNRKNKEDLLKNKNQVSSSVTASTNEVSPSAPSGAAGDTFSSSSVYGIGAAVALAGIAVLFLWKRNTLNSTQKPVAKPDRLAAQLNEQNDIFRMN